MKKVSLALLGVIFSGILICAQAHTICLKKESLFLVFEGDLNSLEFLEEHYEACPWHEERKLDKIISLNNALQSVQTEAFVSYLAFSIGARLLKNDSEEDRIRGEMYIEYSQKCKDMLNDQVNRINMTDWGDNYPLYKK